ncbi:MAG: tRNA epoxyqueuosine(34) reductase QueG [Alphaproteobacteria bacterium]|jgi:epoxyqueuosine reductase|nr:tRNA epoxyqueuosine(34) reductase QueG [Alphaproteobacteria bacterium]
MNLKQKIIDYSKTLGIDAIGFTTPDIPYEDVKEYLNFLAEKNYGDMTWLETRAELRLNPLKLHPPTKTIIMIGVNYFDNNKPQYDYEISIYANQQLDYHSWVWEKAKKLAEFIDSMGEQSRYFVDSAPIMERVFAKKTNIGWQGKHTCIVSRKFGSWLFLGSILTSLEIEPDSPHKNMCGSCTKCIDACPTSALTPYKLDVVKCLSYLSIEHKGEIPQELQDKFGNKVFGCDDCLKACHFNKFTVQSNHSEVAYNEKFPKSLNELSSLNENSFATIFKKTPIKRLGLKNLLRNVAIAMKNKNK